MSLVGYAAVCDGPSRGRRNGTIGRVWDGADEGGRWRGGDFGFSGRRNGNVCRRLLASAVGGGKPVDNSREPAVGALGCGAEGNRRSDRDSWAAAAVACDGGCVYVTGGYENRL